MASRVGSEALYRTQLSQIMHLHIQRAKVNDQNNTHLRSPVFSGVAKDASTLIASSAMMTKIDQYNQNITLATNRTKLMATSLDGIDKTISSFLGYLDQLSKSTTPPDVPKLAKDLLNQVVDYLNLNDGARYLFSGSNLDTAPVKTMAYQAGASAVIPSIPETIVQETYSGLGLPIDTVVGGVATPPASPAVNYDSATKTFFKPNPDNPNHILRTQVSLPPLTTLELVREPGDAAIEAGRVIEATDDSGWRGRIIAHTPTAGAAGANETIRVYIEPMNEFPFNPNVQVTMKNLEYDTTEGRYVETQPPNRTAAQTYSSIGGIRKANIDTYSVQLNAPVPSALVPGTLIQFDPANENSRVILESIETYANAPNTPVLKVRPLGMNDATIRTALAPTAASRALHTISLVNGVTVTTPVAGVRTRVVDGIEAISPPPDYQTSLRRPGDKPTNYYTNTLAAREIWNPQKVNVSDTSTVDYGISADHPGFARLLYTLNFFQQQTSPLKEDDVLVARKIVAEARFQITGLHASQGINQKTLNNIQEENKLQKLIAINTFDSAIKMESAETLMLLNSIQTTLEASYRYFANIQSLNLQNFLR